MPPKNVYAELCELWELWERTPNSLRIRGASPQFNFLSIVRHEDSSNLVFVNQIKARIPLE